MRSHFLLSQRLWSPKHSKHLTAKLSLITVNLVDRVQCARSFAKQLKFKIKWLEGSCYPDSKVITNSNQPCLLYYMSNTVKQVQQRSCCAIYLSYSNSSSPIKKDKLCRLTLGECELELFEVTNKHGFLARLQSEQWGLVIPSLTKGLSVRQKRKGTVSEIQLTFKRSDRLLLP